MWSNSLQGVHTVNRASEAHWRGQGSLLARVMQEPSGSILSNLHIAGPRQTHLSVSLQASVCHLLLVENGAGL